MKYYVYLFSISTVAFLMLRLVDFMGLPLWTNVLLGLILIYIFVYLSNLYNFRDSLDFQNIPEVGYDIRRSELERNNKAFYSLGFEKFDQFYWQLTNDVVIYAYYHKEFPVILCDYHFGQQNACDLVSKFSDGVTLTTSNKEASGLLPRENEKLLQIFPKRKFGELFDNHLQAMGFLEQRYLRSLPIELDGFRKWFKDEYKILGKTLKSPLAMFLLLYWRINKQNKKYLKSIQQQSLPKQNEFFNKLI